MFIIYEGNMVDMNTQVMQLFPELHNGQHVTAKVFGEVLAAHCRYGLVIATNQLERENN